MGMFQCFLSGSFFLEGEAKKQKGTVYYLVYSICSNSCTAHIDADGSYAALLFPPKYSPDVRCYA